MMELIFIGQFHFTNMIPNNQFFFNNKNSFPSPIQFGIIQSNDFDSNNYTKVVNGGTVFNDSYNPSNIILNIATSDGSLLNYIRYNNNYYLCGYRCITYCGLDTIRKRR